MRLTLRLPAHVTFEEVVDALTHAGWRVLTLPPELHHLYPGYWVAARGIIFDYLSHAKVRETETGTRGRRIELEDERATEAFVENLSRAIMARLEGAHCGTSGIAGAAHHLPQALQDALQVWVDPEQGKSPAGVSPGKEAIPPGP
jgi:hypothetical protein